MDDRRHTKSTSQNPAEGCQSRTGRGGRPGNSEQPDGFGTCSKNGFTAVEVVVSMLLASLLMVAMLGVLRGLKAQTDALKTRSPVPSWQRTLDSVLQFDLENSRTYEQTDGAIFLRGFAGRGVAGPSWKPATIVYEVLHDGNRSWLVRRELASGHRELVLADVTTLRLGLSVDGEEIAFPSSAQPETPIAKGLVIEFWGEDAGGLLYGYRFR